MRFSLKLYSLCRAWYSLGWSDQEVEARFLDARSRISRHKSWHSLFEVKLRDQETELVRRPRLYLGQEISRDLGVCRAVVFIFWVWCGVCFSLHFYKEKHLLYYHFLTVRSYTIIISIEILWKKFILNWKIV